MVLWLVAVVQFVEPLPKLVVLVTPFAAETTNAENAKDLIAFDEFSVPVQDGSKHHWNPNTIDAGKAQCQRPQRVMSSRPALDFGLKAHVRLPVLLRFASKDLKRGFCAVDIRNLEHHDQ